MNTMELAEKCGATTDWLGGKPAHQDNQTFTFTRRELQAFYEAAKQQGRDEERLAMSKMEPVAVLNKYGNEDSWVDSILNVRSDCIEGFGDFPLIIRPQPPVANKEGN